MTLGEHPMELLRDELGPAVALSADLKRLPDGGTVEVAGMVVARQRPATARGVVFMLLEDERGTVNLVVPPPIFERFRAEIARYAEGVHQRRSGARPVAATGRRSQRSLLPWRRQRTASGGEAVDARIPANRRFCPRCFLASRA